QQLSDDLERAGYDPFHGPRGIGRLDGEQADRVCSRCATCDGFPSLVLGKSDAEVFGVRPALRHPNVTLLTNAQATRLTTDDAGTTVTGVEVDQGGQKTTFRGDIVVVSAGAANSAALLLKSANDRHPSGLPKGSHAGGGHHILPND